MSDYGDAYREARERLCELMTSLSHEELEREVPTCPGWRTRDVLAHLVGIAVDTSDGNIEGAGSDEYTARQIAERKERSVTEMVAEWEERAPAFEQMLDTIHPAISGGIIGDLVTHEQDARGAVGRTGGRDGLAFDLALDSQVRFFGRRIKEAKLPTLEVRAGAKTWTAGKEEVSGSVEADAFELLRGLTGRRTHNQVRAFGWSVDPGPYLPIFSMYGLPGSDITE
ncbi:MAG: maleylpyruvate isomerase family mycothiol-dependent enzyme [Actinobacteria bacterium]|nr:maleylpyruvate isomerase family mycothiol-dependent enzyme [Actinomycetota bacterium]